MDKAIFFDRDGILNPDIDWVSDISQIKLYDGVADTIAYCRNLGYRIFIVTNQPIVARGMISETGLVELNKQYQELILNYNKQAEIDKIYYCPHHPNANVIEYRILCECRKPKPGMLMKAQTEFNVDLKNSYMIGDRFSDVIAGYLAGCKTVQCLTGKHTEKMITTDLAIPENIKPDYIIHNISELKGVIK